MTHFPRTLVLFLSNPHEILQKVDMPTPPDDRGSPVTQDVVLMRVKVFHQRTHGRTFAVFARIRAVRFADLRLHLLVVHCAHLLAYLVDVVPGGDSTIIQNLVENRQQAVANGTQDLLKVSRNGSGLGFRVNRHDTKLFRHLHTHLPAGIEIVIERYHETSTQKMYMTMNGELNRKHI